MIDIHCHILPNVDDGPQSLDEALEMAKEAVREGIHTIVATSHFIKESKFIIGEPLKNELELFNAKLQKEGIPLKVLLGNEAYISPQLPSQLDSGEVFTINNSRYLLLELPINSIPSYTEEILYQLKLRGIVPIIAHPERYRQVNEDPKIVLEWINKGSLIQINAGSLMGRFGENARDMAVTLLKQRKVHFIGSDGHSSRSRKPKLREACKIAVDILGESAGKKLVCHNPAMVLNNEDIAVEEPIMINTQAEIGLFKGIKNLFNKKQIQDKKAWRTI